ncbi:hypothetical protein HYT24_03055 [Candidatus Pacearchaeota archaeon]|nr:hypothetical protein [Candidatus Pacearchaeota archaeon]
MNIEKNGRGDELDATSVLSSSLQNDPSVLVKEAVHSAYPEDVKAGFMYYTHMSYGGYNSEFSE